MSTPPDQSILPWISAGSALGSALVGGVVGIAVTWLAHIFTAKREDRRLTSELAAKRRQVMRDKLELLVSLVMNHLDALSRKSTHLHNRALELLHPGVKFDELSPEPPGASQLDQAAAIQALYFPGLNPVVQALRQAVMDYGRFLLDENAALAADVNAWGRDRQPDFGTRSATALGAYLIAQAGLTAAARRLIENELADPESTR